MTLFAKKSLTPTGEDATKRGVQGVQLCHKAQQRFLPETLARLEADRVAAVVATGAFNENRRLFDVAGPEEQS